MAEARKIVVFFLLIISTEALKLPDYIKPCSRNDPKFNDCALKNGREALPRIMKGDRKFGVPVLDPMYVEKLSMTQAGIHATSKNFSIVGMKDTVLEDFSIDFDKQIIKVSFNCPRVKLSGKYEINGKLMGLQMTGEGDYMVIFVGLRGSYITNYTLTQLEDGEEHLLPDTYDIEFDMQDMKVQLENLFNGNKILGDSMNNILNENWRAVIDDVGKPAFIALGSIIDQILKNILKRVPYNELYAEE